MARNIGVNFNGQHIVHPGAHHRINAEGLNALGSAGSKHIALIGTSEGGEPGKILTFDNPTDAKAVLRGGDLQVASEYAWSPSGDGVGAGTVSFIRVQDAKKGQYKKDSLVVDSLDWGSHVNRIQVRLGNGAVQNSRRLEFYYFPEEKREVFDNIGPIFHVQYKGDEDVAELSITKNTDTNKASELVISISEQDVLRYSLGEGEYADINKVVHHINEHADFEASMVTVGNKNINSGELDVVQNIDIKAQRHTVTALRGDMVYQTRFSQLASVRFEGDANVPENFNFSFLSGGTNGTTPASWDKYFSALFAEGVKILVPLTGDESIQAECARFVESQSSSERDTMIGVYGGRLGETIDETIGRALTFNSSRAVVAYPGITRPTTSGNTEKLAPYFTAALVAGRIAGKETGDPITLDYVNLLGLERILTKTEVNRLLTSGVTTLEFVRHSNRKGFRIAQGVTTYQRDSNPSYREISIRLTSDELSGELVETMEEKFAGGKGTQASIAMMKNEVQSFLDRKKREEVIVDYNPESVDVRLNGDKVYINYAAIPVGAINYVLITAMYYQEEIIA